MVFLQNILLLQGLLLLDDYNIFLNIVQTCFDNYNFVNIVQTVFRQLYFY